MADEPTYNPYNFVPLPDRPGVPERSPVPRWHRLDDQGRSGRLVCVLEALTPLFTADHLRARPYSGDDKRKVFPFLRNGDGKAIVQGTTLKGMVRAVYEAAYPSSCLPLVTATGISQQRGHATEYRLVLPPGYDHAGCAGADALCPACRLFGLIQGDAVHVQGRVAFSDAVWVEGTGGFEKETLYLKELSSPKPHHSAIYSASRAPGGPIAGRKFYYHQSQPEPEVARGTATDAWGPRSTAIREVALAKTRWGFTVHFVNLTPEELQRLVGCLVLDGDGGRYAHKLGMGKPLGLGSCRIHVDAGCSFVHTGHSRYQVFGQEGSPPEVQPWTPAPAELESLLRRGVHGGETVGYRSLNGYRGMGIDGEGRYVAVGAPPDGATGTTGQATSGKTAAPTFSFADLLAAEAPKAPAAARPVRQGDRIKVEVVKAEGDRYTVRPVAGGPEVGFRRGGLNWQVEEIRQVRVQEIDARGQVKKVKP
jgi:RAMP superfamily protein